MLDDISPPNFQVQEYEQDFPWWEECSDHATVTEAYVELDRLAKAWPSSRFRIVKISEEVILERQSDG